MVGNSSITFELVNAETKPSVIVIGNVYADASQTMHTKKLKYYDVRTPFCDFLQSSYKRTLLNYGHGIFSPRKTGSRIYHGLSCSCFLVTSKSTGSKQLQTVWFDDFLSMVYFYNSVDMDEVSRVTLLKMHGIECWR